MIYLKHEWQQLGKLHYSSNFTWIDLPWEPRCIAVTSSFKHHLKRHLFSQAYSVSTDVSDDNNVTYHMLSVLSSDAFTVCYTTSVLMLPPSIFLVN